MYVRSFPAMGEKYRLSDDALGTSTNPAYFLHNWRADGREIVYVAADRRTVVSVSVAPGPVFEASAPRRLFTAPANTIWLAMLPTGERFLLTGPASEVPPVHSIVLNWPALIERN